MSFDKRELFDERGWRCECGCGKRAHDAHHCLIGRNINYPELDCPENIALVNHDENVLKKHDNLKWRRFFWKVQCDRYGEAHMLAWVDSLPAKLSNRLDFIT